MVLLTTCCLCFEFSFVTRSDLVVFNVSLGVPFEVADGRSLYAQHIHSLQWTCTNDGGKCPQQIHFQGIIWTNTHK